MVAPAGCLALMESARTDPHKAFGYWNHCFLIRLAVRRRTVATIIYPLTILYGIAGKALAVTVPMLLEQVYLWFVINRLTGITFPSLPGQVVLAVLLAGLMYGLLIPVKTMPQLSNIPLIFFMYLPIF